MSLHLSKPILYLITPGASTEATTEQSEEFQAILAQVRSAIEAEIPLIQLREKNLTARMLFELASQAVSITRGTGTRVLINDRADIAASAGAAGVHLTTRSLEPKVIRAVFGPDFLIGCSTHSLAEVTNARDGGADFVVFGPVFKTPSKTKYGPPVGLEKLSEVSHAHDDFPVLALGGITRENFAHCLRAGASGVAGIGLFSQVSKLKRTVAEVKTSKRS